MVRALLVLLGLVSVLFLAALANPALRAQLGIGPSGYAVYLQYLGHLVRGDLGVSARTGHPVIDLVAVRGAVTLELGLLALLWSTATAVGLALLAERRRGWRDGAVQVTVIAGLSIPSFWLGLLLIILFGLHLPGVLPISGWVPLAQDPLANLHHAVLPAFALGLANLAFLTRTLRVSLRDAVGRDHVTFARAMGLSERRLLRVVALPSTLGPAIGASSFAIASVTSGAVVVETVFAVPGAGRMLVDALRQQDFNIAVGGVLFLGVVFVVASFLADVVSAAIDPRLRELYLRRRPRV
jgi:peptide/nickel transport system permease protein